MLREIFIAIASSLKKEFKETAVFFSSVKQGLKDGDFLVKLNSFETSPMPSNMLKASTVFDVSCFKSGDMFEVLEGMQNAIKNIETQNGIKLVGDVSETEIGDELAKMRVSYSFYTQNSEQTSDVLMESFEFDLKE